MKRQEGLDHHSGHTTVTGLESNDVHSGASALPATSAAADGPSRTRVRRSQINGRNDDQGRQEVLVNMFNCRQQILIGDIVSDDNELVKI